MTLLGDECQSMNEHELGHQLAERKLLVDTSVSLVNGTVVIVKVSRVCLIIHLLLKGIHATDIIEIVRIT